MATAAPRTSVKALLAFILGVCPFTIVLLPLVWVTGPAALILAIIARREIRQSGGALGGNGLAIAGLVLGWMQIGLLVLAILFLIALVSAGRNGVHFGY